jgi:sortase A
MRTAERLEAFAGEEATGEDLDRLDLPDARRRLRPFLVLSRVLLVAGAVSALFLAFEFGATKLVASRSQREDLRDFKGLVEGGTAGVPGFIPQPATPVAILSIPIIGARQVVLEGTTPDILKEGPGHVRGTPLPGQVGNAVIAGRRTTYGSPFTRLDELVPGDEIDVTTGQGVFTYVVDGTRVVMPGDQDVLASRPDNVLTLMTSSPSVGVRGRFVAFATLQGPAYPATARAPVPLETRENGLAGDPGGALPAALWGVAFALAVTIAWRLRKRGVDARVLYLLALPIVVTTAFLAFENLDRLLPGTL